LRHDEFVSDGRARGVRRAADRVPGSSGAARHGLLQRQDVPRPIPRLAGPTLQPGKPRRRRARHAMAPMGWPLHRTRRTLRASRSRILSSNWKPTEAASARTRWWASSRSLSRMPTSPISPRGLRRSRSCWRRNP